MVRIFGAVFKLNRERPSGERHSEEAMGSERETAVLGLEPSLFILNE